MMSAIADTLGKNIGAFPPVDLIANSHVTHHQVEPAVTENEEWSDVAGKDMLTCAQEDFELFVNSELTLQMTQAPSPFNGIFQDDTGSVIWGASVCLARYLTPTLVQNKRTMELGCGGGAPSLVACKYGAQQLLATDFQVTTLNRMQQHTEKNGCAHVEVRFLDWQHLPMDDDYVADVIMASDVIYGNVNVTAFIQTINKYLSDAGTVLFATRDGRQGVDQLLNRMPNSGFVEVQRITCNNVGVFDRWRGNHTIHVFTREL